MASNFNKPYEANEVNKLGTTDSTVPSRNMKVIETGGKSPAGGYGTSTDVGAKEAMRIASSSK